MLKKTILTLLIPLPLMAMAFATAMFFEFQRMPNGAANQLSPVEFVQLKISQLLQSQEARAAVSKGEASGPQVPLEPKRKEKLVRSVEEAAKPELSSAEQAALIASAQPAVQEQAKRVNSAVPDTTDLSFGERLSGLFSSKEVEEPEKPRRMICKMHRGYKRCQFPKEK